MDVKKAEQQQVQGIARGRSLGNVEAVGRFIGDVKEECKKMTWTSAGEMQSYAMIVVCMTFFFGMAIYFVDLVVQLFLHILSSLFRLIAG